MLLIFLPQRLHVLTVWVRLAPLKVNVLGIVACCVPSDDVMFAVYCYYAEDTVERNILDLAAKQGLSLYTRDNAAGSLNVTPFAADSDKKEVDAPTKKVMKGDFVYK